MRPRYGGSLLKRFRRVRLVVFEELIFPGVQEEVVLLLAEGEGPSDHFEVFQARDLGDLPSLDGQAWDTYYPVEDGKWIPALLPNEPLETYRRDLLWFPDLRISSPGATHTWGPSPGITDSSPLARRT